MIRIRSRALPSVRFDRVLEGRKRSFGAVLSIVVLGFGCATLAGGPRGFTVEETSFGLYERVGDHWVGVEQTTDVPCRVGQAFGLRADLVSLADAEVRLPIQGEKFEAAEPGGEERRVLFLTDPMVAPIGESRRPIDAVWTVEPGPAGAAFDHSVLVRLFDPVSYHVYLERTFEVKGCSR